MTLNPFRNPALCCAALCLSLLVGTLALRGSSGASPVIKQLPAPRPDATLIITGRREPGEALVGTRAMKYLPFDVPEGVSRIAIHREFDHGPDATRKNTVDFGLFDNRGVVNGIRGWQGGAPGDFVVTGDSQTCSPHAIPGPLPKGRWFIAQYYLVAAPAGLSYRYTVTFSFGGAAPPRNFPAPPPYDPGVLKNEAGWYAGNMHAHTIHSDGGRTLPDMVRRCADAGFDFVVSTEHNSPTAHYRFPEAARANPGVLLLYGDEWTSPGGHANITGQTPGYWFDFRVDPGDGKLPAVIAEAHRQKALFTINHPFAACTSCTWLYPSSEWATADAIEVWNGVWTPEDKRAVDLWDGLLKAGRRITALGGTDYHRGEDALIPATLVYAKNLSRSAVMDGLRGGHAYLTEGPRGPKLLLSLPGQLALPGDAVRVKGDTAQVEVKIEGGDGMRLHFIWADGEATVPVVGENAIVLQTVPLRASGTAGAKRNYARAELWRSPSSLAALSNPMYFNR